MIYIVIPDIDWLGRLVYGFIQVLRRLFPNHEIIGAIIKREDTDNG